MPETIATAATATLLAHLSLGSSLITRCLRARPLVWLGKRSYGVCLYHFPIFTLFGSTTGPLRPVPVVASVVVTVIVSIASARPIEAPIRRWARSRFSSGSAGAAAAPR